MGMHSRPTTYSDIRPVYFPEPSKCILVVRQLNLEVAMLAFPALWFEDCSKSPREVARVFLRGFNVEEDALREWLPENNKLWEEAALVDLASATPSQLSRMLTILDCRDISEARRAVGPESYEEYWTRVQGCRACSVQNILANSFSR